MCVCRSTEDFLFGDGFDIFSNNFLAYNAFTFDLNKILWMLSWTVYHEHCFGYNSEHILTKKYKPFSFTTSQHLCV